MSAVNDALARTVSAVLSRTAWLRRDADILMMPALKHRPLVKPHVNCHIPGNPRGRFPSLKSM
jgi:hypothetical protein